MILNRPYMRIHNIHTNIFLTPISYVDLKQGIARHIFSSQGQSSEERLGL